MKSRSGLLLLLAIVMPVSVIAQDSREQQLEAFFDSLNEAAEAGNTVAYKGLFSPSAVMFVPHRAPLLGRDQIGEWFDDFRRAVVLVTASYEQESIDIVGDVAMVRSHGTGHYLIRATGEQVPLDQKFVDILRYDEGAWLMVYHLGSSSTLEPGLWDRALSQDFGTEAGRGFWNTPSRPSEHGSRRARRSPTTTLRTGTRCLGSATKRSRRSNVEWRHGRTV